MKMIIVSVADSEIGFGRPFFVASDGAAVRSFTDEVNRAAADNILYNHPESFTLYRVGTFDDSTGEIQSEVPRALSTALNVHLGDR